MVVTCIILYFQDKSAWLDGMPMTFANWKSYHPKSTIGTCAKMVNDATGNIEPGLWESANCTDAYPAVCRISASK